MNKHSMAIVFALIGFIVAGFLTDFSTLGIIFGVCLGIFVGYFVAGLTAAKGNILRENFITFRDLLEQSLPDDIEEEIEKIIYSESIIKGVHRAACTASAAHQPSRS